MIPTKPGRLMAVPRTLEVRLEIVKALHTLAVDDEPERFQRRAEIGAVRRDLERLSQALRDACSEWATEFGAELRKELGKYSPDQLRVPSGNPDGGQWTSGAASPQANQSDAQRIRIAAAGGLRCDGFSGGCQSGGTYDTTAMYSIYGRSLCMDCA